MQKESLKYPEKNIAGAVINRPFRYTLTDFIGLNFIKNAERCWLPQFPVPERSLPPWQAPALCSQSETDLTGSDTSQTVS
jgi:hypothetical protein